MLVNLYLLIAPKPALISILMKFDSEIAAILSEPRLWAARYPDRSAWNAASRTHATKLFFLGKLCADFGQYEPMASMAAKPIGEAEFDKWWTITPYLLDEDLDDVAADLPRSVATKLVTADIPVIGSILRGEEESPTPA